MAPRYFLMPLKLGVAEAAVDALVQELEDILSVKTADLSLIPKSS